MFCVLLSDLFSIIGGDGLVKDLHVVRYVDDLVGQGEDKDGKQYNTRMSLVQTKRPGAAVPSTEDSLKSDII